MEELHTAAKLNQLLIIVRKILENKDIKVPCNDSQPSSYLHSWEFKLGSPNSKEQEDALCLKGLFQGRYFVRNTGVNNEMKDG